MGGLAAAARRRIQGSQGRRGIERGLNKGLESGWFVGEPVADSGKRFPVFSTGAREAGEELAISDDGQGRGRENGEEVVDAEVKQGIKGRSEGWGRDSGSQEVQHTQEVRLWVDWGRKEERILEETRFSRHGKAGLPEGGVLVAGPALQI